MSFSVEQNLSFDRPRHLAPSVVAQLGLRLLRQDDLTFLSNLADEQFLYWEDIERYLLENQGVQIGNRDFTYDTLVQALMRLAQQGEA